MTLSSKRIFIVEDNLQNRLIYQMIFSRLGASVEFDRWGRETLHRLEDDTHPFDLIILDLMLPMGQSGYEIFDSIRQISKYDEVPIVAISASDPSTAIPRTQQRGFAGFISKPINDDLLPDQLLRIMAGEKVWYGGDNFELTG